MNISFSTEFTNSNTPKSHGIEQRDLQNFIVTVTGDMSMISNKVSTLHVNRYTETPCEKSEMMITVEIPFQTWTAEQIKEGGTGTHWVWKCYRAKDFSCHNIGMKKVQ